MDTLTFQIRGADDRVIMYKGYLDRGARLESRISGRSITVKGTVTWQLFEKIGDGRSREYYEDIRPMVATRNLRTRFKMRKCGETENVCEVE